MTWTREQLHEHWGPMVRTARSVLGPGDGAEECAALALLQVLERPPSDVDNLQAYLVTVSKRRAIDRRRASDRARQRDERLAARSQLSVADVAEDVVDRAEARWLEEEARARLDPMVYRLLRRVADGEPVVAVAADLGMTVSSANSHLHRARKLLREVWARTLGVLGLLLAAGRRSRGAVVPATAAAALLFGLPVPGPAWESGGPGSAQHASGVSKHGVLAYVPPLEGASRPSTRKARAKPHRAAHPPTGRIGSPGSRPVVRVNEPLGASTRVEHRPAGSGPKAGPVAGAFECLANVQVTSTHIGC